MIITSEQVLKIKNISVILFLVVAAILAVYSILFGPIKRITSSYLPARTISISDEGKVIVSPDIAKFSFSVVTEGKDTEKIVQDNNKKINSAIDFVKAQGISEKDIKTIQYNLSPRYEYDEKSRRTFISGYELTQTVFIKIRDFSGIGKILGELPSLGINQMGSISFDIDDPQKYLAEARNQAFDKAHKKALEMASKNGVKLGKIINFSEYQGGQPIPYYEMAGKGGAVSASIAPSIQSGTQEVTVQVNIIYEIK